MKISNQSIKKIDLALTRKPGRNREACLTQSGLESGKASEAYESLKKVPGKAL